MDHITLHANAKVNLFLDVLRRRNDGYHQIDTLFQSIDLSDELKISKSKASIEITCNDPSLATDERNLVYKAAKLILAEAQVNSGLRIELSKRIPLSAGLGGGSADAAATLVGINLLFELGYALEKLIKLGAVLGADIPFCLVGGAARGEGIGEILTPLDGMPRFWLLVVNPGFSVSTSWVYKNYNFNWVLTKASKDVNILIRNLREGDLIQAASQMYNALEATVINSYPEVGWLKEELLKSGALAAQMSGSGPTVFGLAENESHARRLKERLLHKVKVKVNFCEVISTSGCGVY
jgi:4-diphosphocytidyl-2-C-methyl-D-erythritol kinase